MKIIEILDCYSCPHVSHTGSFQRGGSRPCCNHPQTVLNKGNDCNKSLFPFTPVFNKDIGRSLNTINDFPTWCPLKESK